MLRNVIGRARLDAITVPCPQCAERAIALYSLPGRPGQEGCKRCARPEPRQVFEEFQRRVHPC